VPNYKIIFKGDVSENGDKVKIGKSLSKFLGIPEEKSHLLFNGKAYAIKKKLSYEKAEAIKQKLNSLGILVTVIKEQIIEGDISTQESVKNLPSNVNKTQSSPTALCKVCGTDPTSTDVINKFKTIKQLLGVIFRRTYVLKGSDIQAEYDKVRNVSLAVISITFIILTVNGYSSDLEYISLNYILEWLLGIAHIIGWMFFSLASYVAIAEGDNILFEANISLKGKKGSQLMVMTDTAINITYSDEADYDEFKYDDIAAFSAHKTGFIFPSVIIRLKSEEKFQFRVKQHKKILEILTEKVPSGYNKSLKGSKIHDAVVLTFTLFIISIVVGGGVIAYTVSTDSVYSAKKSEFDFCPDRTLEQMVNSYFGKPKWEAIESDNGLSYVNIVGDITFLNKPAKVLIQYLDESDGIEFNAMELNGVALNEEYYSDIMEKMCTST